MTTYINILYICLAIVLVVDISGFGQDMRKALARWLNTSPDRIIDKPFFCSKCLTVWIGLAYTIIIGELTLPILLYILTLAVMTNNIATIIQITIEAVRSLLDKIYDKIC